MGALLYHKSITIAEPSSTLVTIPLSEGVLYSVNATLSFTGAFANQRWVTIGLSDNSVNRADLIVTLIQGPFGGQTPISWQGHYPIVTDMAFFIRIFAGAGNQFNLGWLQFMPDPNLTSKMVLDA